MSQSLTDQHSASQTDSQSPIRVIQAGLACCGVEAGAVDVVPASVSERLHKWALAETDSQSLAHILVVAGTVTHALAETVRKAYEELAEPRVVVAFGACAITGGPYWDSYSVLPGADQVIPVDFHVPGCPPTPEDLVQALNQAVAKFMHAQGQTA